MSKEVSEVLEKTSARIDVVKKQLEAERLRSELGMKLDTAALSSSPLLYCEITDPVRGDAVIREAKPFAEEMLGYPIGGLYHQPLERLVPERFHAQHREGVIRFCSAPKRQVLCVTALKRCGAELPVAATLTPIMPSPGKFFVVVLLAPIEKQ